MEKRNLRKERIGVVTSNKMEKSIVVSEVKKMKHPMYGKFVLKTKKYVAHDEKNDCNEGDTVKINVDDTVDFYVSNQKYFKAEMGEVKGNASVKLTKRLKN